MTPNPSELARHGIELAVSAHPSGLGTDVEVRSRRPGALDGDDPAVLDALVAAVGSLEPERAHLRLIVDHPVDHDLRGPAQAATRLGLTDHRDLYQLRRPLPVPADHPERHHVGTVALRPFDPERDTNAWVRQNNRAFAHHRDQGDQSAASLAATLAEPWVDLAGFLVADDPERPGELAGSCWTRVHPPAPPDPALGEIFVIGVDPTCHGRGLGALLVLAGLDHLSEQGISTAMLYVDATNEAARRLYRRLGFEPHLRRRVSSAPPASGLGAP
jgi:mycothiol synthase